LWCWGLNSHGQLGDGTTESSPIPTRIGTATDWIVTVGAEHTCGRRSNGTAWCWGNGTFGRLGLGTTNDRIVPTRVGSATDWATVSAGPGGHTCGIRTDKRLWCWGLNDHGQIGDGTLTGPPVPKQVGTATNWSTVSGGAFHTCALRTDKTAWCWGYNAYGQLGDGTTTERRAPVRSGTTSDWKTISAGDFHTTGTRG
jgi:alpha-tubulin suppressor-like RCC1 family protein